MSNICDASIEVISLVLNNVYQQSDLYQCALVNKSFYATANQLLWHEPRQMTRGNQRVGNFIFCLLQSFRQADKHCLHSTPLGHYVRKLYIAYDTSLQDLHSVINNVPLVEELVIRISKLRNKDVEQVVLNCPQLKRLSLNFYVDVPSPFYDFLRHCTNLRQFNIITISNPKRLLASLQHCQLEKLRFCALCFDRDLTEDTFFGGISTLTHLDMRCDTGALFRYCQTPPSRTLFPALTYLRIGRCGKYGIFDNDAVVLFVKAHSFIRTLILERTQIDTALMTSLATDLVHLQRLNLVENGNLPPFTKVFHRVERLTLRGCHMNGEHMAMYFPNLHYIHVADDISTWRHEDDISRLDRPTIETLTKLTYLDFTSYESVPGDLKVHLPRRMGGQLIKEDLDHIRETALGLVWIEQCVFYSLN
ncbi:hypothetical protein [Absidia glauca]|uniref:F-box domain-containing protein n=1 Tax=Absidia glauca TaxID=4829 RepID=A0A163JL32_ABSGL|nr:hypothetical protein [Absidia glauca]